MNADAIIDRLGLKPHPEGGFYRESYRSAGTAESGRGQRAHSTAVYFLLRRGETSRLHRLKSDEVWHFYGGGPLTVAEIAPDGTTRETVLGPDLDAGQTPQHVVPAGSWFGAFPAAGTDFSFVGCTVAPGFDFRDFEMAARDELTQRFPHAAALIRELTD